MNYITQKRIKDLFIIKAGGDLDGMLVEEDLSKTTPYPIYANSAINDGIYGYTNNYKYKKEAITVTARGNLGVSFYRIKPFNAIGRLLILLAKNKNIHLKYINYILQNNKTIGNKTAIPQLTAPEFENQIIDLFEDYNKQIAISNYLDNETAKIERKISILEQKFKKLEEYKQSVIFEAVTKGLDRTVSMKNSGIELSGEIPEHWEVKRVKDIRNLSHYYPIGDGDHGSIKPEMYLDLGVPYIRVQNIGWNGDLLLNNVVYISEEINKKNKKSILKPNDIVISKTGATIGKVAIIPHNIKEANTTSSVGKITINFKENDVSYIKYVMMSKLFNIQIWEDATTKSAQPGFNIEDLLNYFLTIPPKKEQEIISNYLSKETARSEKKKEIIKKQIELLKQYKQAIIYEAVTGKMDIL